ncbi:MAG: hypothetical protein NTV22_17460 [bacterium]|nr:hypothetical protein [bacterium]
MKAAIVFIAAASVACLSMQAADSLVAKDGRTITATVQSYSAGSFAVKLENGTIKLIPAANLRSITFGGAAPVAATEQSPDDEGTGVGKLAFVGTVKLKEIEEKMFDYEGKVVKVRFNTVSTITQKSKETFSVNAWDDEFNNAVIEFPRAAQTFFKSIERRKGEVFIYGIVHRTTLTRKATGVEYEGPLIEMLGTNQKKNTDGTYEYSF